MSTTVLEALQNAQCNFNTLGSMGLSVNPFFVIAKDQLDNALTAIANGKELDSVIQENAFGDVDTGE